MIDTSTVAEEQAKLSGTTDTPTFRLFALLEAIAERQRPFSLQELVADTGLPKPTVHRMLQQLEAAGMLLRQGDGRRYSTGGRLRRLAETLLHNDTHHGSRHAVLRSLVEEIGETCNITALSGDEVVYLDRVETSEPLRFQLRPGSRVPCHATASGKLLLAQMAVGQRRQLLAHAPLRRLTPKTVTDLDILDEELARIRLDGFAIDDEEFVPGLICVAVLVPSAGQRSNLCVAVQAPILRVDLKKALQLLPALQRAARAISAIESEVALGPDAVPTKHEA